MNINSIESTFEIGCGGGDPVGGVIKFEPILAGEEGTCEKVSTRTRGDIIFIVSNKIGNR